MNTACICVVQRAIPDSSSDSRPIDTLVLFMLLSGVDFAQPWAMDNIHRRDEHDEEQASVDPRSSSGTRGPRQGGCRVGKTVSLRWTVLSTSMHPCIHPYVPRVFLSSLSCTRFADRAIVPIYGCVGTKVDSPFEQIKLEKNVQKEGRTRPTMLRRDVSP